MMQLFTAIYLSQSLVDQQFQQWSEIVTYLFRSKSKRRRTLINLIRFARVIGTSRVYQLKVLLTWPSQQATTAGRQFVMYSVGLHMEPN